MKTPSPYTAPNVTADKSTSTEGIWTMDPQFKLIGKFPLATASRSTLYQHCYISIKLPLHLR